MYIYIRIQHCDRCVRVVPHRFARALLYRPVVITGIKIHTYQFIYIYICIYMYIYIYVHIYTYTGLQLSSSSCASWICSSPPSLCIYMYIYIYIPVHQHMCIGVQLVFSTPALGFGLFYAYTWFWPLPYKYIGLFLMYI